MEKARNMLVFLSLSNTGRQQRMSIALLGN